MVRQLIDEINLPTGETFNKLTRITIQKRGKKSPKGRSVR